MSLIPSPSGVNAFGTKMKGSSHIISVTYTVTVSVFEQPFPLIETIYVVVSVGDAFGNCTFASFRDSAGVQLYTYPLGNTFNCVKSPSKIVSLLAQASVVRFGK